MSQQEMADAIRVTRGTYLSYESGRRHPRNRKGYEKLADFFGVDVDYLYGNDVIFFNAASDAYRSRGRKQAAALVACVQGIFAGKDISEDDKDAVMQAIQAAYWEAKNDAKRYRQRSKWLTSYHILGRTRRDRQNYSLYEKKQSLQRCYDARTVLVS